MQKDIINTKNNITQRFCDLYTSTIIENNTLKYPRLYRDKLNGISCLGLYTTNNPQEELEEEIENVINTLLEKEKPFFMGKQIMIQSFLLQDIIDRKILAVLPNIEGEWYALLEGGIKLYLNDKNPYFREKISSQDIGMWTNLELEGVLNNPCYAYKKFFEPYALFEEWNNVFLYALATLEIEYDEKNLELVYKEFLKFIEDNICYVQEVEEAIIPQDTFIKALKITIENIRKYLKGEEEIGISKNILILLKSRHAYLPIIYKIIGKYYSKEVLQRFTHTSFSKEKWNGLLNKIELSEDNYYKGIALEDVADYFISCIEGLKVTGRRVKTENEEIDLVCSNVSENTKLWELGASILVECKNWKDKVDTKVIRSLSYIMDKKGVSTLLLFVKNDVTSGAKTEIEKQAAHNKYIIVFNLESLHKLKNPFDLLISKKQELENEISDKMENLM